MGENNPHVGEFVPYVQEFVAISAVDGAPNRSILELGADSFDALLRSDTRGSATPAGQQLGKLVPPVELERLRQLASRAAESRGGERVLILPGIMGSQLEVRANGDRDLVWIDPLDIGFGGLGKIGVIGAANVVAHDVVGICYSPLRLRLRAAGFDADFHPFDWRRDIADLGAELSQRLQQEPRPLTIVAHSMGGLVARMALVANPGKARRLITLGTPHHGSFAVTAAFDQSSSVIKWLDRVDSTRNARDLAQLFSGFSGLVGMLPDPAYLRTPDFGFAANWPAAIARPTDASLASAMRLRQALQAALPIECVAIVGTGRATATGAAIDSATGRISYFPGEGDGTVPLASAAWEGAGRIWYGDGEHAMLPLKSSVADAVAAIIRGEQPALDPAPPRPAAYTRAILEAATPIIVSRSGSSNDDALLAALRPFVATPDGGDRPAASAPSNAAPMAAGRRYRDASRGRFVVGAGAPLRLEIQLREGNLLDCSADCFALGVFNGIDPSGAASAIDAEMDGAVRMMLEHRQFSTNVGEISILPNGRHLLRARAVAFVGMGAPASFSAEAMEAVGTSLMRTMIATRMDEMAMVPFGTSIAHWTEDSFGFLLQGFVTALREQPANRFRSVTFCDRNPHNIADIRQWLRGVSTSLLCDDIELSIDEAKLAVRQQERGSAPRDQRAYLFLTRQSKIVDGQDMGQATHSALILPRPTQAAAAWLPQPASPQRVKSKLAELDTAIRSVEGVSSFGEEIGRFGLAPDVLQGIAELGDLQLTLVHGEFDTPMPWETLHVGGLAPALAGGVSHRYLVPDRSIVKWSKSREPGTPLNILLVADPTSNLPGAIAEAEALSKLAAANPRAIRISKELLQSEATHDAVLAALSNGGVDIMHYAGHAFFDPINRAEGGLQLAGNSVLTGRDVIRAGKLPALIFFNACEAARVRGEPDNAPLPLADQVAQQASIAEALLRGGVGNFVGTYWKVKDEAAKRFSDTFYRAIVDRQTLNAAVLAGRRALMDEGRPDWANYVFYGDPDFNFLAEG